MKRILLSFGLCLLMAGMSFGQSTGDIAFVGFNADGDDDFAIVALVDISANTTIYFTDNEPNAAGDGFLDFNEGSLTWDTGGSIISAGTVITFTDTDSDGNASFGASVGTLTTSSFDAGMNLSGGGDAIYAVVGTPDGDNITAWLAGAQNESGNEGANFSATGLTAGTNFVDISGGSGSPDGGAYDRSTTSGSKSELLTAINNSANWNTETSNGENVLPFTTTSLTVTSKTISGNDGWRLLTIPKASATVSDISDDTAVQGVTGGSDASASSNVFTYDDTGSYETPSNVSTVISDGYGLAVYFYNNTTNGSSALPLTLDISGSEPGSDVAVTLNKNNTAGTVGTGGTGAADSYYTLVGNPFQSNYNLNSITVTGGAIQNNVQLWDDGNSTYQQLDRTSPSVVSLWQGFWVEVLNANGATSITFPTSGKSTSSPSATYFSKENPNSADINFTLSSETTFDEAIKLSFRDYAELGMDRADASKLVPLITEYATMAFVGEYQNEEKLKSVESLPSDLEEAITIPLRPTLVGVSGEFTFSWEGLEALSNKMSFTLHDYDTGSDIDMSAVTSYTFMAEANAASKKGTVLLPAVAESESNKAENRFGITITPNTSVGIDDEIDAPTEFALGQNYPNPFNPTTTISYSVGQTGPVTLTVYNVMGQKVAELVNATKTAGNDYQVTWDATAQASGIYYYRLATPGQVLTRQMTLIK